MDTTYRSDTEDSSIDRRKTAGALLREARKVKGFSKEKVASHLNLMPSHILALESDAYNPDLEGRHFVDYLTAYADLVELNPRAVKDLYRDNEGVVNLSSKPYEPLLTRRQTYQDLSFSSQRAEAGLATPGPQGSSVLSASAGNGFAFRIATVLALVCLALLVTSRGIGPDQLIASLESAFEPDPVEQLSNPSAAQAGQELQNTVPVDLPVNNGALDRSRWSTPEWASDAQEAQNAGQAKRAGQSKLAKQRAEQTSSAKQDSTEGSVATGLAAAKEAAGSLSASEFVAAAERKARVDELHANDSSFSAARRADAERKRVDPAASTASKPSSSSVENRQQSRQTPAAVVKADQGRLVATAATTLDFGANEVRSDAAPALTNVVSGAGEDVMVFTFYDSCWIEVYDREQNPLVMDTKMPGEALRIAGKAPFEVRVGNSRAVGLTLNGSPVAIERHPTIASTELIVGS